MITTVVGGIGWPIATVTTSGHGMSKPIRSAERAGTTGTNIECSRVSPPRRSSTRTSRAHTGRSVRLVSQ